MQDELLDLCRISTHTPLAGRDELYLQKSQKHTQFLLTRPLRDVTAAADNAKSEAIDFYSHAPCGT